MPPRSQDPKHRARPARLIRCWLGIGLAVAAVRVGLHGVALLVQRRLNPSLGVPLYHVSPVAQSLHDRLLAADLHADALLWDTNLLRRHSAGHVDLPRLRSGNVALQVFGVVTKVPRPGADATFGSGVDLISLLSVIELWPARTWFSLTERALFQARKLAQLEARSRGQFKLITSARGLDNFIAQRERNPGLVAGLLALEGVQALEGSLSNVELLYRAGFRMMSLTHLSDNDAGGSSLGSQRHGLTPFGRQVIRRLEERRVIIDLAHASPALFGDVLAATTRPVLVSHTGVQGVCPNPRNLSDDQIRAIAARGGLIGIGFDALFTCAPGIKPIADSIRYVAGLVGPEYVAIGSDFDGAIQPPFDASGLAQVTAQLIDDGFPEADIRRIMGENALRFLEENLP
jgi:membrane dipeptidase